MTDDTQSNADGKIGPENPFFEIIEEAYHVFDAPTPTDTGVCRNCCMNAKIEADFFNPAIRELPLNYLHDWYFAACGEGEMPKATWSYVLPRLLECLAAGESPDLIGVELSLRRFQTGVAKNWRPDQWAVLDRFQRLLLQITITGIAPGTDDEMPVWRLDDMLCMFGLAGWPLDDLFAQVMQFPDIDIVDGWPGLCWDGKPSFYLTAHWDSAGAKQTHAFFTSDQWRDRMTAIVQGGKAEQGLTDRAREILRVMDAIT